MKRLLFYDLDGTLVDTRKDIVQAVNHMLTTLNAPALSAREIEGFVGEGMERLIQECLGTDDPQEVDQGMDIYKEFYTEHQLDHTVLYPHTEELLQHFQSRHQVVITNKPNPFSQTILTRLGVAGYLEAIIAGNSNYPRKPDPTSVNAFLKQKGVDAKEAIKEWAPWYDLDCETPIYRGKSQRDIDDPSYMSIDPSKHKRRSAYAQGNYYTEIMD